ncbi:uncharacterized protein LOC126773772 [Nymphalis io]|uniref:uncharacterized protein LOC126773772 n=1 Tax=Inachis io TaxID=171585 RepID=UPI00216A9458|nr:uncharacterized protein LOC126773772 [Nymphalis io]
MPRQTGLVIKRHNIRIWCHECDMGRLQRVVWEGQGARLLSEVSSQPIVKKFLEAVPYIMNTIRDIHSSVIQNDLEGLMKLTADPIPPQALSSRDANNLTAMHKAAGLGHGSILKYIIERYPEGINDTDNDGRTPLHYAAIVKDEQHTYNTLISFGADEGAVDNKNKTPAYYVNRAHDIDKNIFKMLPEAPRTPSSAYPASWDWKILGTDYIGNLNKKSRKKNLKASSENISSKNNTNTISDSVEINNSLMKNSSTHELISGLPDLNDSEKLHAISNDSNEEDAHNEDTTETENVKENSEKDISESTDMADEKIDITSTENAHPDFIDKNDIEDIEKSDDKDVNHENTNRTVEDTDDKNNETENVNQTNEDMKADDIDTTVGNNKISGEKDIEPDKEETTENVDESNDTATNEVTTQQEDISEIPEIESNEVIKKESNEIDNPYDNSESTPQEINENENSNGHSTHEKANDYDHNDHLQSDSINEEKDHEEDASKTTPNEGNLINGRNIQESLIEGIISSEAEQETQDASITQRDGPYHDDILIVDNEIDPEVTDLINTANMEMLATLVLNGEGSRLIGRQSRNTELQAFLNNVPTYMQKINKVHVAAREGNLKDLQAALDRRKFAIARDPISPNGATPLHVATVFGKSNIMKYLGGRFPETLSAVDFEGRTALHYAAVLPDNGHYYNVLQQLGANSKDLDDNGRSAEDYLRNLTLFPFRQMLRDFSISDETADAMFSDKGTSHAVNGHMDIPIFHTEEGRYLAKSLGDPLIKGLTEVANIKPKDPVAFLASFLHNFPENEKPRLGTQETNVLVTKEAPEVDNEHPPFDYKDGPKEIIVEETEHVANDRTRTATRPHKPIDVITVDPQLETSPDTPETALTSANRDEHGQSMLHFAAARAHTNNALFQLLQESDISLGYRDELYRTARDVSIQANVLENTAEIDRWVLHLAARGKSDKIMELLLQGYDHILDVVDDEGVPISDVVVQRGDNEMSNLLASIPPFEESREALQGAIRHGDLSSVQELLSVEGGRTLALAQNALGRNALHIAVLAQHEDIVEHLVNTYPEILRLGDNLERTALHYAMGVEKMESLSHILIRAGAKRVLKDLKGRQPSYYFMNKSDILRLKEEEEAY